MQCSQYFEFSQIERAHCCVEKGPGSGVKYHQKFQSKLESSRTMNLRSILHEAVEILEDCMNTTGLGFSYVAGIENSFVDIFVKLSPRQGAGIMCRCELHLRTEVDLFFFRNIFQAIASLETGKPFLKRLWYKYYWKSVYFGHVSTFFFFFTKKEESFLFWGEYFPYVAPMASVTQSLVTLWDLWRCVFRQRKRKSFTKSKQKSLKIWKMICSSRIGCNGSRTREKRLAR